MPEKPGITQQTVDSLKAFADCAHNHLTCDQCKASATFASWVMPQLAKISELEQSCKRLEEENVALQDLAGWLQAAITALNTGPIHNESPLHRYLRKAMADYRKTPGEEDLPIG